MSNINPIIFEVPNPKGIDLAILKIQQSLSSITYLHKIFGRAYMLKETNKGKEELVPKVYQGTKEFYTALPNDQLISQVLFIAAGPDEYNDYEKGKGNIIERDVALIFWGNLKKINPAKDYIFTEDIKADFMRVLMNVGSVKQVKSVIDEEFEEIYREVRLSDKHYESKNQPITYPFAGLRFNLVLSYRDGFECNNLLANQNEDEK